MIPARYPDGLEVRAVPELRATGRKLEGYAATFGTPAAIGGFTETIKGGAFRSSLASGADVLALVDHDCEIATNSDPLRGVYRVQTRPL